MSTHQTTIQMLQTPYFVKSATPWHFTATQYQLKIAGLSCGVDTPGHTASYSKILTNI